MEFRFTDICWPPYKFSLLIVAQILHFTGNLCSLIFRHPLEQDIQNSPFPFVVIDASTTARSSLMFTYSSNGQYYDH